MPDQPYRVAVLNRSLEHSMGRRVAFVSRSDRTVYLRVYQDVTLEQFAVAAVDAGAGELAQRLGLSRYSARREAISPHQTPHAWQRLQG